MSQKKSANRKTQVEYAPFIQSQQKAVLSAIMKDEKFLDGTIIIGREEEEYKINRTLLSAFSPYFKTLLFWCEDEKEDKKAKLKSPPKLVDIEPEIFECIINFCYAQDPHITINNILSLIKACDKYQITSLSNICYDSLKSHLNENNFYQLCSEAMKHAIFQGEIENIFENYFANNYKQILCGDTFCSFFTQIIEINAQKLVEISGFYLQNSGSKTIQKILVSNDFVKMNLKTMRLFLKTEIMICSEESLWEAVLKWANYQRKLMANHKLELDEKQRCMIMILHSIRKDRIRFPSMEGKYFVDCGAIKILSERSKYIALHLLHPDYNLYYSKQRGE